MGRVKGWVGVCTKGVDRVKGWVDKKSGWGKRVGWVKGWVGGVKGWVEKKGEWGERQKQQQKGWVG